MLTKLYSECCKCSYKDSCQNKKMEGHGFSQPAVAPILEDAAAPVLAKHNYRDIKIDTNTTVTIDLEDMKKKMVEEFYKSQGLGLMLGG